MKNVVTILLISYTLMACQKEYHTAIPNVDKGVLLVNEGNFNWGNAGLSLYDPANGSVSKDIFKEANGFALGDVAQSAIVIDSLIYVVVNNSAKIVVLSAKTFKQKSVIAIAGSSPRYIMPVNDSIAYVSELYANKIWIVNLFTGASMGSIAVDGETNQMVKVNSRVFVAERTKFNGTAVAQVRVINSVTHQTEKVIPLPSQPNSICADNAGTIWVLTDTSKTKSASLLSIQSNSFNVVRQLDFSATQTPQQLRFNTSSNTLCYLFGNAVYSYSSTAVALPISPLFTVPSTVLYAFDIDGSGNYYLADAIDYTQSSRCFVYADNGSQQANFSAGINTNQFVFLP